MAESHDGGDPSYLQVLGPHPPSRPTMAFNGYLFVTSSTCRPSNAAMVGRWSWSKSSRPVGVPTRLAGAWWGAFRSWRYLKSLQNRERFGATPRFLSTS